MCRGIALSVFGFVFFGFKVWKGGLKKGGSGPPFSEIFLAMDDASNLAVVVQKAYDWNIWVFPHVEKFPKSYRFSLGENLVNGSLSLLMNLVDATYHTRNTGALGNAVRDVNRLRYLVRMSKDLKVLSSGSYEFAAKGLDEIGRMAGGWFKSARAKEAGRA